MDYWSYNQSPQENIRRSKQMETTSLLLGVISIATIYLVYPTLICGSLAIVFALLSRGGEFTLSSRAKVGVTLGSIGLGVILLMIIYVLVIAEVYYGGFLNMAREVYGSMGIDFDALLNSLAQ